MFGIPEWAIGIGVVLTFVSILKIVTVRLMPPGSVGRYGSRKFSFKADPDPDQEELQSKIAELEDLKRRMGELEERLDFAERLLAQKRESAPPRLQP
jgi:hypothetical protein